MLFSEDQGSDLKVGVSLYLSLRFLGNLEGVWGEHKTIGELCSFLSHRGPVYMRDLRVVNYMASCNRV